ncbi:MAG: Phosphopantetheine adenylyltransferase (EC [uncultured Sulfurovum sp.]|uniref:Phosphopantetheine adenylyltransferase n=1 Tax=uncultured Sulfurovum sp. TaxID=269237 RepID=A0A6S6U299_9BACT|nr:MAG: Phosphopantetheine adenylyltransferase (EC [uncultured Sulfurovum sp.]
MEVMSKYTRALYPGTFDPITVGHLDIIKRAYKMFDEIIIAVADSQAKKPMFSLEQRVHMAKAATMDLPNIKVIGFHKLLVDLSDELDANILVRGLRAVSDFEYELQMGYANASLKKDLETVFLMPSLEYGYVSSSVVRSILPFNGKVDHLLHPTVHKMIKEYRS